MRQTHVVEMAQTTDFFDKTTAEQILTLAARLQELEQSIKTIIKENGVVVSRQARRITELETALRSKDELLAEESL